MTAVRQAINNFLAGRKGTAGTAVVEYALIAPMLLVMIVYVIDFGFYIFGRMQVQHAAQAGAQYAVENVASYSQGSFVSGIESAVKYDAANPGMFNIAVPTTSPPTLFCGCPNPMPNATGVKNMTPTTPPNCPSAACTDGTGAGTYVTVSAQGTYATVTPVYGFSSSYTLTATATVRIQ